MSDRITPHTGSNARQV